MRLIAASVVLNEIDIIEAFVRHNLSIVSKLLVIDNGSTDGTRQVLQSLVEEGLPLEVQDEPTVGYRNRLLFQNHLRKLAIANPEIEWFLPLDADEFLLAENAQELIPAQATPESPVALRWQSFASTSGDDAQEQNPVRRVRHRLVEEGWPWTKILLPRSLVLDETVKLLPGQHGVERNGQNLEPVFSDVQMAHFPIRSPASISPRSFLTFCRSGQPPNWKRPPVGSIANPFNFYSTIRPHLWLILMKLRRDMPFRTGSISSRN